jgi:hypothetical protein
MGAFSQFQKDWRKKRENWGDGLAVPAIFLPQILEIFSPAFRSPDDDDRYSS